MVKSEGIKDFLKSFYLSQAELTCNIIKFTIPLGFDKHFSMHSIKRLLKEFRALRISLSHKFVIGVIAVLTITMGLSLYVISKKHTELVMEQVDVQAKTLFKQVLLTRRWIADHGGVFVEKLPWKESNPYLKDAEITDIKGKRYIKESPAMVTKELSRYAKKEGLFWFHITSLKLINPQNVPDDFEKKALMLFEEGDIKELSRIEKVEGSSFYRYIAPLYVEKACLRCHAQQGYKVGDIRGAISVTIPIDNVLSTLHSERRTIILAGLMSTGILILILYLMMKVLVLNPVRQIRSSMKELSREKSINAEVIRTGDELEDLSKSFVEMSGSLKNYQDNLREMVHSAIKSLEEANARLAELNKKKSDYIARVSHELRTPLTSIKGAMEYISARLSSNTFKEADHEEICRFINLIRNNTERLIRMVNDTLDLEKIESGVFDLHMGKFNILQVTKEVIHAFYTLASEKGIIFKLNGNPDSLIIADEDRIRQVIINLISNAIKFSPPDSEIRISIIESNEETIFSISDEGSGIPDDEIERIFDKFYTRSTTDGTGLGLAICKGIVEAHGGKIRAECNKASRGCTFYFNLPKSHEYAVT
jgi:signal transduction histidine kinase